MTLAIFAKHFHDEVAAFAWVESSVWPNGPVCPHCGGVEHIGKMKGKTTRLGLYKCYQCYKPFTVRVGTIFAASHVPLRYWLQAMSFMTSSKKGISSNQLHRMLGVTLTTAWFMSHRIREAMRVVGIEPMGGGGKIVEIDETLIGRVADAPIDIGPGEHFWFRAGSACLNSFPRMIKWGSAGSLLLRVAADGVQRREGVARPKLHRIGGGDRHAATA